ncbi:DUF4192 domain-containing protein [Demequina sp. SYSU T00192]|uniref:DUF4192 domain-containing protein n=1 Tax=Demequina litoralis TaxID=3051660 RepID=A0ABT8G625_9MICO|nr:DUF4192 domain-containing protein [Demequina sp. SYSU T00192]MDN4474583.1 DUF4192 domain-containing protein [Demequina sp. SYSU T00192]
MTTITGPGELVSLLPSILGFQPRESVVTVLLRERGALGAILRLDVSDLMSDVADDVALDLARLAMQEGARRAVVVGYAADEVDGCLAVATAAAALEETVAAVETWMVADGRYYCPSCEDPACCPPGGRTVPAVRPGGPTAWTVARDPGASRAPARERRLASRAARRWEDRATADPAAWRDASARHWRVALDEGADGPAPLGRLAAALADVRVRDALLLMLIPGASRAVRDALAGRDSAAVARALGAGMRPARPPDPGRVDAVTDLLVAVLEHAPPRLSAAPAATLAVIAWWEDDPDVARAWCAIALDHDPGYRLALLTLALIDHVESAA